MIASDKRDKINRMAALIMLGTCTIGHGIHISVYAAALSEVYSMIISIIK